MFSRVVEWLLSCLLGLIRLLPLVTVARLGRALGAVAHRLDRRHRRVAEENLARAVAAYDDVLAVRTAERDPVGHARTLLNQANALAHLGQFDVAAANLTAAAAVFAAHGCADELAAVEELSEEMQRTEAIP